MPGAVMTRHWSEDYRVEELVGGSFEFVHTPSDTVLLRTQSVSMETLNGLMNEFNTFGEIRPNWREWWAEHYSKQQAIADDMHERLK